MTAYLRQAFAADFNDRRRDSNFPDPKALFKVQDIDLTGTWSVDRGGVPPRLERPLEIWEDDAVLPPTRQPPGGRHSSATQAAWSWART